jgi:hypothetical protein
MRWGRLTWVGAAGAGGYCAHDAAPMLTIRAGDYVVFHQGFACQWQVLETMTKAYCYFDADGKETVSNSVGCDLCVSVAAFGSLGCRQKALGGAGRWLILVVAAAQAADCSAESYLMDGEVDLCPACFVAKVNHHCRLHVYMACTPPAKLLEGACD